MARNGNDLEQDRVNSALLTVLLTPMTATRSSILNFVCQVPGVLSAT